MRRARPARRLAAGAVLAAGLLAWAGGGAAAERGVEVLDAAFLLSEFGFGAGDPTIIASAAEAVLALAGGDATARGMALDWLGEARFQARGDRAMLERIAAVEAGAPDAAGHGLAVARLGAAPVEIGIGPGETRVVVRIAAGAAGSPRVDQAGRPLDCAPLRTGGLGCAVGPGAGPLTARVEGVAEGAALLFHDAPTPSGPGP